MALLKALKSGAALTPKAHLIYIALAHLGPGTYKAADLATVLGYPAEGRGSARYASRIHRGARQLSNVIGKGVVEIGPGRTIVYREPVKPVKKAAKKRTPKKVADEALAKDVQKAAADDS